MKMESEVDVLIVKETATEEIYEFNSHWVTITSRWTEELMVTLHAWYTFDDITAHIDAKRYT